MDFGKDFTGPMWERGQPRQKQKLSMSVGEWRCVLATDGVQQVVCGENIGRIS